MPSNLGFTEVMKGRVAPQSFDATQGYRDVGAIAVYLHADIDIHDLDDFVDPAGDHRGRLSASVVIPVLGQQPFTADDGVFELFRPGQNPDDGGVARLMVYDAVLTGNERVYRMQARKYLKPRRFGPWRLWKETTTLEVTLRDITHGGRVDVGQGETNAPGGGDSFQDIPLALREIIGGDTVPAWLIERRAAVRDGEVESYRRDFGCPTYLSGVLHLSPGGLVRLMTTMHATGVPCSRRAATVARFLTFFAAGLARIYLRRDGSQVPV